MRRNIPSSITLGGLVLLAAFLPLFSIGASATETEPGTLVLRPTHRHGADPLDPDATWFVSSYTATEPRVPHVALDGITRENAYGKAMADPLRRTAEQPFVGGSG